MKWFKKPITTEDDLLNISRWGWERVIVAFHDIPFSDVQKQGWIKINLNHTVARSLQNMPLYSPV